jgi:hypothetical protein
MNKINILVWVTLLMTLMMTFVSAADFVPSGNINCRNVYAIYNCTNVTAQNGFMNINWSYLQNIPFFVKDWTSTIIAYIGNSTTNGNYSQYTNVSNLDVNSTQLNTSNHKLSIITSWLTSLFYEKNSNVNMSSYNLSVNVVRVGIDGCIYKNGTGPGSALILDSNCP